MIYEVVFFLALLSTALALGAALAHAYEMPNKMALTRDQYFVVQNIYRGWNRLAILLAIQGVSIFAVMLLSQQQPRVFLPAAAALGCLIAAQVVFWAYTYPANVATENWTAIPDNWIQLRRQWEYSHAAGAGLQVLAMSAIIIAALMRDR